MDRYSLMPSYKYYNAEGSPLTFPKSAGQYLRDYKIYGSCGELTAEGKYKIPIKVKGKNLFDYTKYSYSERITFKDGVFTRNPNESSYITFPNAYDFLEEGKTYTLSAEIVEGELSAWQPMVNTSSPNLSSIGNKQSATGLPITFTIPKGYLEPGTRLSLTFAPGSKTYGIKNIQLEEGTTATEYEPYKEPIVTDIYLDEPLADGEYIDYINQKLVKANGETDIYLPAIKTLKSTNIIEVNNASNIRAQYYK